MSHFGSETQAFRAIERAAQDFADATGTTGLFREVLNVGPFQVTVKGNVIGGTARIGTAYIP